MKARLPSKGNILKEYTQGIADRTLKMACIALINEFGFGQDRLTKFLSKISEVGNELCENPHLWVRIDEQLIDKRKLPFEREDLIERELSAEVVRRLK